MSSAFEGKVVLVTGAAGFIGANLVATLEKLGAKVFGLARKNTDLYRLNLINTQCELIIGDLSDCKIIQKNISSLQPDYVFHTITILDEKKWQENFTNNTIALVNLVRVVSSPNLKKFVNFGSSHEYGDIESPYKECALIQPCSLYGVSRSAGTLLLQQMVLAESLPIATLRPFYVYGPLEPEQRFISTIIRAILNDKELALTEPGYMHDYIFVSDVIEASLTVALDDKSSSMIFNIASGIQTANEKIVTLIGQILEKIPKIVVGGFPARNCDRKSWCADVSLAKKELGWASRTSLSDGLKKTIEWYYASAKSN